MIQLERLTHDLDVGDWQEAYRGIVVTLRLNPPGGEWEPGDGEKKPWDTAWDHAVAEQLERVTIPARLTDDATGEVIEIRTARDFYELSRRRDFDPAILTWALRQYSALRNEWVSGQLKNSGSASGTPAGT